MSKIIDRIFGWLLVIGALLHAYGSLMFYGPSTVTLVWALSGSLAALLLAALNLMRINRPADRTLAYVLRRRARLVRARACVRRRDAARA